jgi:IS605 OrfB family transposase
MKVIIVMSMDFDEFDLNVSSEFTGVEEKFIKMNGKKNYKKHRNLKIKHNCDLVMEKNEFWLHVVVDINLSDESVHISNFCGVDPGVRTFATTYNKDGSSTEYLQKQDVLVRLNLKIKALKMIRHNRPLPFNFLRKRVKKISFNKLEKRKKDFINHLHWRTINDLLDKNDLIFMGDIKSHGIVKNSKKHKLNQAINDLNFFQFKQRLMFKANVRKKIVILVNEAYTSQGCSSCGSLYKINSDKVYRCKKCLEIFDRDTNSAKNILMKGFLMS